MTCMPTLTSDQLSVLFKLTQQQLVWSTSPQWTAVHTRQRAGEAGGVVLLSSGAKVTGGANAAAAVLPCASGSAAGCNGAGVPLLPTSLPSGVLDDWRAN